MIRLIITLLFSMLFSSTSLAEDIPLVDGNLWSKSDTSDKHS
jgi:hypothetical protein